MQIEKGQFSLDLPDDCFQLWGSPALIINNKRLLLMQMSSGQMIKDIQKDCKKQGQPTYFLRFHKKLYVYPAADQEYTISILYSPPPKEI